MKISKFFGAQAAFARIATALAVVSVGSISIGAVAIVQLQLNILP